MGSFQRQGKDSFQVKKASGEVESFSAEKLERSLRMTGASFQLIQRVIDRVRKQAGPGIITRKLYRMAFQFEVNIDISSATRQIPLPSTNSLLFRLMVSN